MGVENSPERAEQAFRSTRSDPSRCHLSALISREPRRSGGSRKSRILRNYPPGARGSLQLPRARRRLVRFGFGLCEAGGTVTGRCASFLPSPVSSSHGSDGSSLLAMSATPRSGDSRSVSPARTPPGDTGTSTVSSGSSATRSRRRRSERSSATPGSTPPRAGPGRPGSSSSDPGQRDRRDRLLLGRHRHPPAPPHPVLHRDPDAT